MSKVLPCKMDGRMDNGWPADHDRVHRYIRYSMDQKL